MAIGERIRFFRNLRGMTQKWLGQAVGFPQKTADIRMAQYESGSRTPKDECNRCLGCKTLHPQVGIINLENPSLEEDAVKFEFYAVLLIEDCPSGCC